jgi:hypothetical protein
VRKGQGHLEHCVTPQWAGLKSNQGVGKETKVPQFALTGLHTHSFTQHTLAKHPRCSAPF